MIGSDSGGDEVFDRAVDRRSNETDTIMRYFSYLLLFSFVLPAVADAETFLVKDGSPLAEIIIAGNPPRSTRLAAHELQTSIAKISGAKLTIATTPSADVPVKIYVGASFHAEQLGVNAAGLKHGAYRIVSGENWLALMGDDTDFVPVEPWAKNRSLDASRRRVCRGTSTSAVSGFVKTGRSTRRLHQPAQPVSMCPRSSHISTTATGSAEYFTGLQGAARMLTCRGQYDEALKVLDLVDVGNLGGSWGVTMLFARAQKREAAGRNADALKDYRAVLSHAAATNAQRNTADESIKAIQK